MDNNLTLFLKSLLTNAKKSVTVTENTTLSDFINQCEDILNETILFITVGSKLFSKASHGMQTLVELGIQSMSTCVASLRSLGGTQNEE